MKVALLGLGTVGKAVYDIINNKIGLLFNENEIIIKYVLVRNIENRNIDKEVLTTSFEKILNDCEIELVIEAMGAQISYQCIKSALSMGKSVITANKEVIALHIEELEEIANQKKVKLLYEASVGGGIPIVETLTRASMVNNITKISGILNGTTNYILTRMQKDKLGFNESLELAKKAGFAEADPTADLEGLDMVRKIAILSRIAYHTNIDIANIYHYGIANIDKSITEIADVLGYKLKFMANSFIVNNIVSVYVEPVLIIKNDLLANVDYENNVVEYLGDNCSRQIMYGKGAGFSTANSIVNDLYLYLHNKFVPYRKLNNFKIDNNSLECNRYLLKISKPIPEEYIYRNLNDFIITNPISRHELEILKNNITFYAIIKN